MQTGGPSGTLQRTAPGEKVPTDGSAGTAQTVEPSSWYEALQTVEECSRHGTPQTAQPRSWHETQLLQTVESVMEQ